MDMPRVGGTVRRSIQGKLPGKHVLLSRLKKDLALLRGKAVADLRSRESKE
jgi:hypothetical protein